MEGMVYMGVFRVGETLRVTYTLGTYHVNHDKEYILIFYWKFDRGGTGNFIYYIDI